MAWNIQRNPNIARAGHGRSNMITKEAHEALEYLLIPKVDYEYCGEEYEYAYCRRCDSMVAYTRETCQFCEIGSTSNQCVFPGDERRRGKSRKWVAISHHDFIEIYHRREKISKEAEIALEYYLWEMGPIAESSRELWADIMATVVDLINK